jgi:hypothetical protein
VLCTSTKYLAVYIYLPFKLYCILESTFFHFLFLSFSQRIYVRTDALGSKGLGRGHGVVKLMYSDTYLHLRFSRIKYLQPRGLESLMSLLGQCKRLVIRISVLENDIPTLDLIDGMCVDRDSPTGYVFLST